MDHSFCLAIEHRKCRIFGSDADSGISHAELRVLRLREMAWLYVILCSGHGFNLRQRLWYQNSSTTGNHCRDSSRLPVFCFPCPLHLLVTTPHGRCGLHRFRKSLRVEQQRGIMVHRIIDCNVSTHRYGQSLS